MMCGVNVKLLEPNSQVNMSQYSRCVGVTITVVLPAPDSAIVFSPIIASLPFPALLNDGTRNLLSECTST